MSALALWKLIDLGIAALEFGFNRSDVVTVVRLKEEAGASREEISKLLAEMADKSETDAQDEIDKARG